jgi:type IV secretion system protein VirB10
MSAQAESAVAAEDGVAETANSDSFRLSADPPRVARLSRKVIAFAGGTAGLAIAGVLFWALRPPGDRPPSNLYDGATANRPEAITGAPGDYGAVPQLGPPLPADLGRPIAAAQRGGEMRSPPAIGREPPSRGPARAAAEQARQHVVQERGAARSSPIFGAGISSVAAPARSALPVADPQPAVLPERASGTVEKRINITENPERIRDPSSPLVVQAGSVIPAALITGIQSDLAGQVTAQVIQNVYDSPTGRHLLIPQGARLIGEYDSDIATGQKRVLLAWDRLILPGGRSIDLGRLPGADAAGMAGLTDRTDNHWGGIFKAALISTLLGVGGELGSAGDDRLIRAIRSGTQDSIGETGRQIVQRQLAPAPTLTIRPGYAFRVIVTRDLVLEPARGSQ